jgi:hypothetical protein
VIVEEDAVAALARTPLERQRDQVAEAASRHGVLTTGRASRRMCFELNLKANVAAWRAGY